jgi:hypothetical protein
MRIMLAGLTGPMQHVKSYRSFRDIIIRDGDALTEPEEFTRGDVMRMTLCDTFLENKQFDAIALLDLDMVHPKDLLENLRSHDLPMVTAHYWKRRTPMESIVGIGESWPYKSLKDLPDTGLMEVSTSGFGAVLIKREVVEAVAKHVHPEHPFAIGPVPEMANGENPMGSDMRFFHYARSLGYKLMLDCSQESLHYASILLSRKLYKKLRDYDWEAEQERITEEVRKEFEI